MCDCHNLLHTQGITSHKLNCASDVRHRKMCVAWSYLIMTTPISFMTQTYIKRQTIPIQFV